MKLSIQKIADVPTPSYKHEGDAGFDVHAASSCVLASGERKIVPTGIKMAVPSGFEAQVRPRSGLAAKYGISVVNTPGTVDSGYRGEVGVILINHGNEAFTVEKHERIAQIVINKIEVVDIEEVPDLDNTSRGEGGFGSTGTK